MVRREFRRSRLVRAGATFGLLLGLCAIVAAAGRPSAYPGKNGRILFGSDRGGAAGVFDLYTMNSDGTALKRLTTGSLGVGGAFSADGRRIVFTGASDGDFEIYLMNADGTGLKKLTNNTFTDSVPDFSPDGKRIAFVSDAGGNPEIWLMNADGSGSHAITSTPAGTSTRPGRRRGRRSSSRARATTALRNRST